MTRGRCESLWSQTIPLLRAVVLASTGKEPPLKVFVPAEYLPTFDYSNDDPDVTEEDIEELREKKAKLDAQIIHLAITEGRIRRR